MSAHHVRRGVLVAILGLLATLASSMVSGTAVAHYPDIMGCEVGCVVAAGGWPLPFIIDYPGISPVGSVSLVDAMIGIDQIAITALVIDLAFWTAVGAALLLAWRHQTLRGAERLSRLR